MITKLIFSVPERKSSASRISENALAIANLSNSFLMNAVLFFFTRMHETEAAMNKYGSEALIKKQKERKRDLDKASALLDTELQAVRAEVAKFESLDADLVRQYLKIQQELGFSKYVAENFNERLGSSSATEDESLGKLNLSDEDPHSPL